MGLTENQQAFPRHGWGDGVSLRAYIASNVLVVLAPKNINPQTAAKSAVSYADALIVELNKEKNETFSNSTGD